MRTPNLAPQRAGWIALLTAATLAGSFVFACATPFPAVAALAALHMNRRDAFVLTGLIWAANQTIGYGFLHYPPTWDSFAWGIAIGIGAIVATAVAIPIEKIAQRAGRAPGIVAVFVAAFAAYEAALYAATAVLPSDPSAFGLSVVLYLLEVNAAAFGFLLVLQSVGGRAGLAVPRQSLGRVATTA
jgi:hypothetical protein